MARAAGGRLVTTLNGLMALALVVLLAVVALVVKPPSPPGIAEFAPQAAKPITKAPPGQAAQHGTGPGACATGQTCSAPPPTAVPTAVPTATRAQGVPSALQCYEWPDGKVTQTFDPQSPPCIASWTDSAKGNGGATTRGVTATEVQITMSKATLANSSLVGDSFESYVRDVLAFFNSHYELYGRSFHLVINYGDTADNPSKAHAAAQAALNSEAFAAVLGVVDDGAVTDELARNQMVSVNFGISSGLDARGMAADAPYAWTYEPPEDTTERNLAAFVCTSLKGKKARFSSEEATKRRKFVIHTETSDSAPPTDPKPLQQALKSCGLDVPVVTTPDDDTAIQTGQQAANTLKANGTTTVLSLDWCCNQQFEAFANQVDYHPEWVYFGKQGQYDRMGGSDRQNGQATNRIGLAPTNKLIPKLEEPYYRAAPSTMAFKEFYTSLQIIAAGVQMAGPHLTPNSFAQALYSTDFPNPGAGSSPHYQAAVGFSHEEPWAVHDFAVWWPDTRGAPDPRFGYPLCYADAGRRWSLGTWTDIEHRIKGGPAGC